jgi:pyridoxine 4-dehydrogenase
VSQTQGMVTAADSGTYELGSLTVRRMGFGAMRLTGSWESPADQIPADRGRSIAVLRRALELGVNHIDTAAFYFSPTRSANELINTALAQIRLAWTLHRGPQVLAIPGTGDPDHLVENVAAGALRLSAAELSRLDGRDQVDN